MTEPIVSAGKILCMSLSALVGAGVPIALFLIWRKKTGAAPTTALCGAMIFVVFVYLLESAFHQFCIYGNGAIASFITGHPAVYVLYAGLAAGVFEETGRYAAFRLFLRKRKAGRESVMYGIGHGGVESFLVCSMSMISNLVMAFSLNAMGAEAFLAQTPEAGRAAVEAVVNGITTTPAGMFLVSGAERIIAIALHIGLSVLVFAAAREKGKGYLYPVAILLHALVDCYAVLYSVGVLPNIFVTELGVAVMTAVICFFAWRVYRSLPKEAAVEPAPSPEA